MSNELYSVKGGLIMTHHILMDPASSSYCYVTHSVLVSNSLTFWGATIDEIY